MNLYFVQNNHHIHVYFKRNPKSIVCAFGDSCEVYFMTLISENWKVNHNHNFSYFDQVRCLRENEYYIWSKITMDY